ncbi:hypothetical protein [Campylobacter helveticus]|uniref:hypothetical protein n=1 Tax=Campylobacter helveticus TaxID=28898 RepID=UPI0010507E71|nr:hypothetical protein [Campylobacter helveticus]QBL11004.1 hypothetical protein A0073_00175 [Campylobacter helveticus]
MNQEALLTKMLQRVKLTHIDKIGFSSNNHLKNFLESYAFNLNPKYENELTIYNDYYEIETKLSKEALKSFNSITQKERKTKRYALLKEAKELKRKQKIKIGLKIRKMKEKPLKNL